MTADEMELPRGIALAWGVAANPQRGPKREMSVERIVEAAVALADAEGLGAVSMAAVASKLGFTPMSLYRYVSAKDDLLLLMQEQATGLPPEGHDGTDAPEAWQERLRALFDAQVRIYLEHPWILSLPITGAPITPSSSAWLDAALGALEATPLNDSERMAAALSVMGHSRWYGIVLAGYAEQARLTGLSPEGVSEREAALFDRVITAEEFPALRHAIDAGVFTDDTDPFRFGLQRILDGVSVYMAAREGGAPADGQMWHEDDSEQVLADKRVREARKAVREAEKALRTARKEERITLREARARVARDAEK